MAKPILVTLPFVLLLLDYWPLGRFRQVRLASRETSRLVLEKTPLLVLALASSIVTFLAQRRGGAVLGLEAIGAGYRAMNALMAYCTYLTKTIWPLNLSVFYPYRLLPGWQVALAAAALAAITVGCLAAARSRPYLIVGWLWFVGTLVPVIGLVQVGSQAMADRYTYLPLIGIFIAVIWGIADVLRTDTARRGMTGSVAVASVASLLLIFGVLTERQVLTWTNSVTLWQHALDVSAPNPYAESALASALALEGHSDRAAMLFENVLRVKPNLPETQNGLAQLLAEQGRDDDAIAHFREAIRLNPGYAEAHHNLGVTLMREGRSAEAIAEFLEALRLNPDLPKAHNSLGDALARQGKTSEAIQQFEDAIRLKPGFADAHENLGKLLAAIGRPDDALAQFAEAARLDPQDAAAPYDAGVALMSLGKLDEAVTRFRQAIALDPNLAAAHNNLANALSMRGDIDGAIAELREAVRCDPKDADFRFNLAVAYVRRGRLSQAADELRIALQIRPDHAPARQLLDDVLKRAK